MTSGDRVILESKGKAELLAQHFVKVHSVENLWRKEGLEVRQWEVI